MDDIIGLVILLVIALAMGIVVRCRRAPEGKRMHERIAGVAGRRSL
jgi:hypothetical protein